ncbi:MAG TPA: hypothetical protein VHN73_03755, partial [Phenylobacterium sp.]|nr:hypothetical protein [Phenylobacterium sp.]
GAIAELAAQAADRGGQDAAVIGEHRLAQGRGQAPRPVVTADEAIRALDLALAVEQALEDAG